MLSACGSLVAVPAALVLEACGDDSNGPPPEDSGTPDSAVGEGTFDGTTTSPHAHTVTVDCADLGEEGATYASSTDLGHSHQVMLSAADLAQLANGEEVFVVTSDEGHDHTWTIQMAAGECE